MELLRFSYKQSKCVLKWSSTDDKILPSKITIDTIQVSDKLLRVPEVGIFNPFKSLISPMYCGDLGLPHITWGYYKKYALIFHLSENSLDISIFKNSSNVAHSIYYDYLNGRHDLEIEKLTKPSKITNSNIEEGTVTDYND